MALGEGALCRVPDLWHFAECLFWHSAKGLFAECPIYDTQQRILFAECFSLPRAKHSAKRPLPSACLCRVRHSAKGLFAECPIFGTRRSARHSAKCHFPVVRSRLFKQNEYPCRIILFLCLILLYRSSFFLTMVPCGGGCVSPNG